MVGGGDEYGLLVFKRVRERVRFNRLFFYVVVGKIGFDSIY